MTEFVFVRHGETDANLNGILQGNVDVPLNATGIWQAEAAADYLAEEFFDAAFASPLSRAEKTAEIIVNRNKHAIPLALSPELREWHCGEIDGLCWEDIHSKYQYEARSFCFEQLDVQMPGGESGWEFQHRVENFLQDVAEKYKGKRILLISHGGVLQRVFRFVAGAVADGNILPLCGNASINTFCRNDKLAAWQLTSWNQREHLKDIPQHISRVL